jgi:hypothetical protein
VKLQAVLVVMPLERSFAFARMKNIQMATPAK